MNRLLVSDTSSMLKDDADTPIGDTTGATWANAGASARLPLITVKRTCILSCSSRTSGENVVCVLYLSKDMLNCNTKYLIRRCFQRSSGGSTPEFPRSTDKPCRTTIHRSSYMQDRVDKNAKHPEHSNLRPKLISWNKELQYRQYGRKVIPPEGTISCPIRDGS